MPTVDISREATINVAILAAKLESEKSTTKEKYVVFGKNYDIFLIIIIDY